VDEYRRALPAAWVAAIKAGPVICNCMPQSHAPAMPDLRIPLHLRYGKASSLVLGHTDVIAWRQS
jgi:hypothetical protein